MFRIKALVTFGNVKKGELGGFVEKEENLCHIGNCWVSDDARVFGNAWVSGNARVSGNVEVSEEAWVSGNAQVSGATRVSGDTKISGCAKISGDAWIFENAGYTVVKGFGSENRTTTFFLTKDKKVGAQCGCFYGTLEEFRRKVKETHKDTQFAKEYLMIADLMELHFIPLVDHLVIEE